MSLLSTGCGSLTPPPGLGTSLRYAPREAAVPALAEGRRAAPEAVTAARQNAIAAQLAFLGAVRDVSSSTRRISGELSRLKASKRGIAGRHADVFIPFVDQGVEQLRWIDAELGAALRLSNMASELDDPDMALALLRLGGPRLQSALLGSLLLAAWLDFLNLADVVLKQCPYYSVERLFAHMHRLQMMLEPTMTALASLETGQVESAATDLPALMGHLTDEHRPILRQHEAGKPPGNPWWRRLAPGSPMARRMEPDDHEGTARRRDQSWPDVDAECDPEDRRKGDEALWPPAQLHSLERKMTEERSWEGNWKVRLYERVRERGYASLTAFAEARPTASLVALAEELGGDDVNAVQVFSGLVAEAERSHRLTRLVRGQLVRELWESLPDGWPAVLDDEARLEVAIALGSWSAFTPATHEERVRQVGDALLATPPPPGWRPLGPDDELLLTLLPDEQV